ncbi:MAG: flagellar biosynthesis anti-sigma factor FlgM [Gammaproteobacteria bacterium]|nr:flagellar biosynthesis anti-sigma factor FlgM [Gammaproteobacteria bacterium]
MAIEITGQTTAHTGTAGEGASVRTAPLGTPAGAKAGADREAAGADMLSLTGTGTLMQRLDAAVAAAPEVDMERVARLRQAIEDGSYEIDPARVAEKMLAFESAFQSRGL